MLKNTQYEEVRVQSCGVPITLSVWTCDPAATTVVFYPGTMSCSLYYTLFLECLVEQGFNVVGLHPLSHGKSPRIKKLFTFEDILHNGRDAVAWASTHFSGPVVIAGHSQGGILALAHAAGYASLHNNNSLSIAAVFLLCTMLPQHPRAIELTLLKPFARWHAGLQRAVTRLACLVPLLPVCLPMYLNLFKIVSGGTSAVRSKGTLRAFYPLAFIASLFNANLEQATQEGNIRCPVDVISAVDDALFTPELMRCIFMEIAAPDKKQILLAGGGHMAPLVPRHAAEIAEYMAQRCASLGLPLHPKGCQS